MKIAAKQGSITKLGSSKQIYPDGTEETVVDVNIRFYGSVDFDLLKEHFKGEVGEDRSAQLEIDVPATRGNIVRDIMDTSGMYAPGTK